MKKTNSFDVTKQDLAARIAENVGISQVLAEASIGVLFSEILKHYANGRQIRIHGFGTFYPHRQKGRSYVVPRTKEVCTVPTRTVLRFRPYRHTIKD